MNVIVVIIAAVIPQLHLLAARHIANSGVTIGFRQSVQADIIREMDAATGTMMEDGQVFREYLLREFGYSSIAGRVVD